jgi:hypothetical protein
LLGIKPVRSDAEHVVALDAHAVDDRTNDGTRLGRFGQAASGRNGRFLRDTLSGHRQILTRRGMASKGADGIHTMYQLHPLDVGDHGFEELGERRAGRKIGNGAKESVESRAALAKMKSLGAFLTGVKQATDKKEKRCA